MREEKERERKGKRGKRDQGNCGNVNAEQTREITSGREGGGGPRRERLRRLPKPAFHIILPDASSPWSI